MRSVGRLLSRDPRLDIAFQGLALIALATTGCGSASGARAASLGGEVVSALLSAPKSTSRKDTYEYRHQLERAKERCWSATTPTRFVVLDANDHVGGSNGVRLVRFNGCQLDWLDGCHTKDAAAYRPRAPLAGASPAIADVEDEIDLYDRFPLWAPAFLGRVARGQRLHVEVRATSARITDAKFSRASLAPSDDCTAASHWIASIEYGALRVNVDAAAYAGERELEAQKELGLGSYGACGRDEEGACDAPVAITIVPLVPPPSLPTEKPAQK